MSSPRETAVVWTWTGDVSQPYVARVGGHDWRICLGDFPAEPLTPCW